MSDLNKKVAEMLIEMQKGDLKQFEHIIENTAEHLRMIAGTCLVNRSSVDEVVSDTYIRVWKYIESYKHEKGGFTWLVGILKNVAHDYNVKDARLKEVELVDMPDPDADFSALSELRTDLGIAVRQLNEESQKLIYYSFVLCKSSREIAVLMNMKRSTVSYKLNSALKKLREIYNNTVNSSD